MYFKKLEKLKEFKVRSNEAKKVDQFLANASAQNLRRFSPVLLSRGQGIRIKRAAELLLMCSRLRVTKANYELECPNGDSDIVVHDLRSIPRTETQCRICFEEYTPDEKSIWLTFDLIGKTKLSKKKVDERLGNRTKSARKFSIKDLSGSRYFQNQFVPEELFNLDMKSFGMAMRRLKEAESTDEKKHALENLSEILLCACSVFNVTDRNRRTATAEIDRIFSIAALPSSFIQNWGEYLICECKNWEKPANSQVIDVISANMRDSKCNVAILFSKKGVTGKVGRDAVGKIRNAYSKDHQVILVITERDLQMISRGKNFIALLEQKYRQLRFEA